MTLVEVLSMENLVADLDDEVSLCVAETAHLIIDDRGGRCVSPIARWQASASARRVLSS